MVRRGRVGVACRGSSIPSIDGTGSARDDQFVVVVAMTNPGLTSRSSPRSSVGIGMLTQSVYSCH